MICVKDVNVDQFQLGLKSKEGLNHCLHAHP